MHVCFLFYSSFCFGLVILVFGRSSTSDICKRQRGAGESLRLISQVVRFLSVCILGGGWFKPLHIQVELDE